MNFLWMTAWNKATAVSVVLFLVLVWISPFMSDRFDLPMFVTGVLLLIGMIGGLFMSCIERE